MKTINNTIYVDTADLFNYVCSKDARKVIILSLMKAGWPIPVIKLLEHHLKRHVSGKEKHYKSQIFEGEMDQRWTSGSTPAVNHQQWAVQILKWPAQPLPCVTCTVVTGALCDWSSSYANALPLISFDSALHISCGLDYVHTRTVQV